MLRGEDLYEEDGLYEGDDLDEEDGLTEGDDMKEEDEERVPSVVES